MQDRLSEKLFGFKDEEEVLRFLKEHEEVTDVRFFFVDILGRQLDSAIPSSHLEGAFNDGKGFDGSSVEGMARIEESDIIIRPDPKTFRVFNWEYEHKVKGGKWKEAVVFGDIVTPEGDRKYDTRHVLKKALKKGIKEHGFDRLVLGPELEFFIFESAEGPELMDRGGYFHGGRYGEVRKEAMHILRDMGIDSEFDHHEVAPSQHEVDLRYSDALTTADSIILARYVIQKVARAHNVHATFMPKPIEGINGSGMHVHQSIWKGGKNIFFSKNGNYNISNIAKHYMAGLMHYSREMALVLNQWVNSYKRLMPGYEAPVYIAWGRRNRSAFIRIPEYRPGKEDATRIELRSPDPLCNPYLAFAVMYTAGLIGIEKKYRLNQPVEEDIYGMLPEKRVVEGIDSLPASLEEAIGLAEGSRLLRQTLGKHIFDKFIANKKIEWKNYMSQLDGITGFEMETCF